MSRYLIVGYGNPDRQDDGVAWKIMDELSAHFSDERLDLLTLHQLEIEMCEDIGDYEEIIFVDARVVGDEPVIFDQVQPEVEVSITSHHLTPASLLALSKALYGKQPKAWMLSIRGWQFDFGDDLSPECASAMSEGIRILKERISRWLAD